MSPKYQSAHDLVQRQLNSIYPTSRYCKISERAAQTAFEKTAHCVSKLKQWRDAGFDHWISWQYATYLYFLSRFIYIDERDNETATKIFLLNKALNSIELFYKVDLPSMFFLSHTVGIVFSQSTYNDYFVIHQGCTVGRSSKGRPVLEAGVIMYPNSMVIGRCHVRENTVLAPGARLINQDSPGNCYVFNGKDAKPFFKPINNYHAEEFFDMNSDPL